MNTKVIIMILASCIMGTAHTDNNNSYWAAIKNSYKTYVETTLSIVLSAIQNNPKTSILAFITTGLLVRFTYNWYAKYLEKEKRKQEYQYLSKNILENWQHGSFQYFRLAHEIIQTWKNGVDNDSIINSLEDLNSLYEELPEHEQEKITNEVQRIFNTWDQNKKNDVKNKFYSLQQFKKFYEHI